MKVDFVHRLTHEDILNLIPFYHVYDFEECEPTRPETRRFLIRPTYDGLHEEIIIGNSYASSTVRFYGVKEKDFIKFMIKKFGQEYFSWFAEWEYKTMEKKIQDFTTKNLQECMDMIHFGLEQLNDSL